MRTALRTELQGSQAGPGCGNLTCGEGLLVRIAQRRDEFRQAFNLLYRAYRARGYVEAHPHAIVYRLSYGLSTSRTIVALSRGEGGGLTMAGTLTVVGDGCLGLPMERDYPREVRQLRGRGRRLAEVSGLAIAQQQRSPLLQTFYLLTRFLVQYSCSRDVQDLLITVHPRHAAFYRDWFCFEPCGPVKPCTAAGGHRGVAYRLDLERLCERGDRQVYMNYFHPPIPYEEFDRPGMRQEDHLYFCCLAGLPHEAAARRHRTA